MKLWIDEHNDPPSGYHWAGSVNMAIEFITEEEAMYNLWHRNPTDAVEEININSNIENIGDLIDWINDTKRPYNIITHDDRSIQENVSSGEFKNYIIVCEIASDEWKLTISKISN